MFLLLQWQFSFSLAITILSEYGMIFQLYTFLIKFMDLSLLGVGGNRLLANYNLWHWLKLWGLKLILIDEFVFLMMKIGYLNWF